MEFFHENTNEKLEAARLLIRFEKQVEKLQKTDVQTFHRKIKQAPDVETKSKLMRNLLEMNVPASVDFLERLIEKHKSDKLLCLEWMNHRQHAAMCSESFSRARSIATDAYTLAKDLYQGLDNSPKDFTLPRKSLHRAYIKACMNLLLVCRYQGKLKDAELYLEEAINIANLENDEDNKHLLQILKGDLLLAKGQLNYVIEAIFTPLLKKPSISLENKGLLLQKLGNACRSAARWGLAKEYLRESITIAQDLGDRIAEYDRATDLGNVYRSEGRIADALDHQVPHMAFAFKRGDLWGLTVACFNMGFAYYSITPKPDLKRALILLAVKHDLATQTENEPLRGMALNNLGKTFCALGQYEMTLKVLKQSVKVAKKTLNVGGEGMAYGNIGTAYRYLGKYDEAIENHNKYLLNAKGRGDDGGVAIMQRELTIDYVCKGDFENAEKQAWAAISTLEIIREKLGGEDASRIANFDKNQSETYNLLQVILSRQGKHAEALALSELARSRALTDLIRDKLTKTTGVQTEWWIYSLDFGSRWKDLAADILADYIKSADELNTNFVVYSVLKDYNLDGSSQQWLYIWLVLNKMSTNGGDRIYFQKVILKDNVQSDMMVDDGYFASLTRSLRLLSEGGKLSEISIKGKQKDIKTKFEEKQIRVSIPDDPDVQEFLTLLQSISLTNITTNKTEEEESMNKNIFQLSDDMKASDLNESKCERSDLMWEPAMERGTWKNEGLKQLLQLYEICIAPIDSFLPNITDDVLPTLTIIPHEFLFSVPFCCLHSSSNDKYLVERFVLSYAPSLRSLLLLNQRYAYLKENQGNRKLKILAIGDPVMALPGVRDLPYSGDEAKHVQAVFGPGLCELVLRRDATKQRFLQELSNVDILHVATHASPQDIEAEEENCQGDYSMRGSLLLASSDNDCEGVVKASEIASMNCACQLITLSCCETGLGKVTGDGVVGLYRAFFAAGAASIMVTLWKIRDDITTTFMEHFYNEFKVTGNVPCSLRSAMLYSIREKRLPPQQWAAFSFIGAIC